MTEPLPVIGLAFPRGMAHRDLDREPAGCERGDRPQGPDVGDPTRGLP